MGLRGLKATLMVVKKRIKCLESTIFSLNNQKKWAKLKANKLSRTGLRYWRIIRKIFKRQKITANTQIFASKNQIRRMITLMALQVTWRYWTSKKLHLPYICRVNTTSCAHLTAEPLLIRANGITIYIQGLIPRILLQNGQKNSRAR